MKKRFQNMFSLRKKKTHARPGVVKIKRKIQKPGPPIILERFLMIPDVVGIIEGSRFLPKIIDFARGNVIWVSEGS